MLEIQDKKKKAVGPEVSRGRSVALTWSEVGSRKSEVGRVSKKGEERERGRRERKKKRGKEKRGFGFGYIRIRGRREDKRSKQYKQTAQPSPTPVFQAKDRKTKDKRS